MALDPGRGSSFLKNRRTTPTVCIVGGATVQKILRHSSITMTAGTYVEVIDAVQRDALDSMSSPITGDVDASPGRGGPPAGRGTTTKGCCR